MHEIDEYLTSKICCWCRDGNNRTRLLNAFDTQTGENKVVYGTVCCTNRLCRLYIDRDINAAANIQYLTEQLHQNNPRPEVFKRKKS